MDPTPARPDDRDQPAHSFAARLCAAVAPLRPGAAALARLLAAGHSIAVPRGAVVLEAGQVADRLLHVHRGLLRSYYRDPARGDERTGQFFDAGSVVTDAASFLTGSAAEQTFEALEDSSLFVIPRAAVLAAYDEDHAIERFGRRMIEAALVGAQRRAAQLLNLTADERYTQFMQARGDIARRVPQYVLASHLGVTPESLSRIRARLARRLPLG